MKAEILSVAEIVAKEKGITREDVITAMEMAIQQASRAKYGTGKDIRVNIDRKSGNTKIQSYKKVVANIEDEYKEVLLDEALHKDKDIEIDQYIIEDLPPFDFSRIAAQTSKKVINQYIKEVEREVQYNAFKDRIGEVVNAVIKRTEYGNVFLDLGTAEGIILRNNLIPRENIRMGNIMRAYIEDVRREPRGAQIFLSRTNPQFLAELFKQEVTELYDGQIEIKAVARDPGSRAKFAVYSPDRSVDPVGICVGIRGNRVQEVIQELQGEKIDIITWAENPANFIVNSLIPAEVSKVVMDEDSHIVEVIVPDDQLSIAIGRSGQNVKLASELTGWKLDIKSESVESTNRNKETLEISKLFMEAMDIDDVMAHLLISEGFKRIEEIAAILTEELVAIEGFELEIAKELQSRANAYLELQEQNKIKQLKERNVDQYLQENSLLTTDQILLLAKNNIKTREDLSDLSSDELLDLLPNVEQDVADKIIMTARDL